MTLKHWLFVHSVLHWCCCDTQQTRRRLLWGETSDCWRCSCPHAAPPPRPSQTVSAFHPKPSTPCQEGWHCCSLTAYQIQLQNQMKELLELFDSDSFLSEYFPTTLYYCHTQMYLFYCSCSLRNISVLFFFTSSANPFTEQRGGSIRGQTQTWNQLQPKWKDTWVLGVCLAPCVFPSLTAAGSLKEATNSKQQQLSIKSTTVLFVHILRFFRSAFCVAELEDELTGRVKDLNEKVLLFKERHGNSEQSEERSYT